MFIPDITQQLLAAKQKKELSFAAIPEFQNTPTEQIPFFGDG